MPAVKKMYKVPAWFDEAAYLKSNPDVAKARVLGKDPFRHFVQSGYTEKRTWEGDPRPSHKPCTKPHVEPGPAPDDPIGKLGIGETHTIKIDGFTGKEADTKPTHEDNPEFDRQGVHRASGKVWYSSRHVGGKTRKWVDYRPDIHALGAGEYDIDIVYRATRNRAKNYDAYYYLVRGTGEEVFITKVNQYSKAANYTSAELGVHRLAPGDFIRAADNHGTSSIAFGNGHFKRVS